MPTHKDKSRYLLMESDRVGKSYFGNPYALGYEKFVMEHLGRHQQEADDIESVVILGYN